MPMSTVKGQLLINDAAGYARRGNGERCRGRLQKTALSINTTF